MPNINPGSVGLWSATLPWAIKFIIE
jgi:hypothetical protein